MNLIAVGRSEIIVLRRLHNDKILTLHNKANILKVMIL